MKKIKLGILGVGGIFTSHAHGLCLNKDKVEVVACANALINDAVKENTAKLLETTPETIRFYEDYKDLIENEKLDAVEILLPHHLHAPAAIMAAEHGMNILIEKPMARTTAECDAILAAAEKNGVSVVICHDRRYNDEWRSIKDIVSSGKIGEPLFYRLEHNQNFAPGEGNWAKSAEMIGGGCIMSCLTHQIDALRWIGGEMTEVTCMTKIIPSRMEGECMGVLSGPMENGALAQLSINWHSTSDVSVNSITPLQNALWFEFIHVIGTKGEAYYLANKGVFYLEYKTPDGTDEMNAGQTGFVPYFTGGNVFGHDNIVTEWLNMLLGISDNIVSYGKDSRNTVAIAEAAYDSVREKRVMPVKTVK